jgi:exonuclease III
VRVVTLNVWGTRAPWAERRERLRAGFDRLDADLITLQETILDGSDQAREILGPDYHLVHSATREKDGQGITTTRRNGSGRRCWWPARSRTGSPSGPAT